MNEESHFHYTIHAFDVVMLDNNTQQKQNTVELVFIERNHDKAFEKAKSMMSKAAYQIVKIEECADPEVSHSFTSDLQREVMLNQIETLKRDKKNNGNIT